MSQETESVTISRQHSALIMIEFQREWLDDEGKLGSMMQDRSQFQTAIAGGKRALDAARSANLTVAHVGYSFSSDYKELVTPTTGMDAAIVQHGTFTGRGAEFADDFAPLDNEFVASGRLGVSAFAGSNLDGYLRRKRVDTLFLSGFALQACIESTARAAKDLGYQVYVIEDATAAFSADQKRYIFEQVLWMVGRSASSIEIQEALQREVSGPSQAE